MKRFSWVAAPAMGMARDTRLFSHDGKESVLTVVRLLRGKTSSISSKHSAPITAWRF